MRIALGRPRVALAVPPVQVLSPYSNDATVLSKLSVAEGLTALDEDGAAAPAPAKSWKQTNDTTWTFELRKATFQGGTPVTTESVANGLDHTGAAETKPRVLVDVTLTAKAEDADTVTISTKAADPVLPLRLARPVPGSLSAKAYGKDGPVSPVSPVSPGGQARGAEVCRGSTSVRPVRAERRRACARPGGRSSFRRGHDGLPGVAQ